MGQCQSMSDDPTVPPDGTMEPLKSRERMGNTQPLLGIDKGVITSVKNNTDADDCVDPVSEETALEESLCKLYQRIIDSEFLTSFAGQPDPMNCNSSFSRRSPMMNKDEPPPPQQYPSCSKKRER